jgi:hypothetical protein
MESATNVLTVPIVISPRASQHTGARRPGFLPAFIRAYAAALCIASQVENRPRDEQSAAANVWFRDAHQ